MSHKAKNVLILSIVLIVLAIASIIYTNFIKPNPIDKNIKILRADLPAYCQESPGLKDPHGRDWGDNEAKVIAGMPKTNMRVKLVQVNGAPGTRPDLGLTEQRDFDIFLERTDANMKEESCVTEDGSIYTSDLAASLQPKRIFWDDTNTIRDSGNTCNTSGFPHRCSMSMAFTDKPVDIWIKVVFQDNTYAEQKISVPFPGKLDEPVLILPKIAPKSGENFYMEFKDIGADTYDVSVNLCEKYGGRGINPCLDGWNFIVQKKSGEFVIADSSPIKSGVILKDKDGSLILSFDKPLPIEEKHISVSYLVIAAKTGQTDQGVSTYIQSRYSTDFSL